MTHARDGIRQRSWLAVFASDGAKGQLVLTPATMAADDWEAAGEEC